MSRFWEVVWWLTDDYERIRMLRCKVLRWHIPQTAMESRLAKVGLSRPATMFYEWRATGREDCAICHKDLGPISESFKRSFPSLFEWH